MKTTKKIGLGITKVIAALLGAALMPILIWVALGAALKKGHGYETGKQQVAGNLGTFWAKPKI